MLEEAREGWFVVNVREASWYSNPSFGLRCKFEKDEKFRDVGIGISVLEPGKPACRYHRESAQENFLILSGRCTLLVNDEERQLGPWDFVHCPPGVSHVFVGAGDEPCVILMVGHRPPDLQLFYPANDKAKLANAEAPEATSDPRVAYSDVPSWKAVVPPEWPMD